MAYFTLKHRILEKKEPFRVSLCFGEWTAIIDQFQSAIPYFKLVLSVDSSLEVHVIGH